ncbi:exosortase-associated protein EpsI, V-type [Phenylobacterium sp.]|uniref:exosortase-associated protein EpsI, V-type n=1 Tax=Phenylobacterium sp. TaxID=1871053 RepID=UPI0038620EF0
MIARRDLLMGAGCAVAALGANALKPHRLVPLLVKGDLAAIVPATFGGWRSEDVGDPLAINGPGTLSAKLYNQLVTRIYTDEANSAQVMMLLAYGREQTDDLQLHRPEVCYPAFGYALTRNQPFAFPIAKGVEIPARRLLAEADERRESVIYWSRIGEYLPTSGVQQRKDRLEISLQGIIPDGLLSRFSTVTENPNDAWRVLETFIPGLLASISPAFRNVLIGTARAQAMAAIRP